MIKYLGITIIKRKLIIIQVILIKNRIIFEKKIIFTIKDIKSQK